MKYTIVLPCRNEEMALPGCIRKIRKVMDGLEYEIVVSDSSSDDSYQIAKEMGVKVVKHNMVGYGNACMQGIKRANGEYVILGDADGTYDFDDIPKLLEHLVFSDMVIGDRLHNRIVKGSMPLLHRYVGNPILSKLVKILFNVDINDSLCGIRAFNKDKLLSVSLKSTGMEFGPEMVIKAKKNGLTMSQVPINYKKRIGKSKLRTLPDGWKVLRFILSNALVNDKNE